MKSGVNIRKCCGELSLGLWAWWGPRTIWRLHYLLTVRMTIYIDLTTWKNAGAKRISDKRFEHRSHHRGLSKGVFGWTPLHRLGAALT